MSPGELKPLLTALLLPPAGPLLLALSGLVLARRRWAAGALVGMVGIASLWFLSCNAVGIGLAQSLLPQVKPLALQSASMANVQAIVVLGGGVLAPAPEYGKAQPSAATLERLRYGAWLARQTKKPLGFAGGVGWSATGTDTPPEAEVAKTMLRDDYGLELRWADDRSRDTAENATRMAVVMRPDRIQRIALVTHATHMPRAQAAYEKAGFHVTPAPIGFAFPRERQLLEWLPSVHGLELSRQVLREWLGRQLGAY
jgi:uncharacterized SAM-binding protein YcdF (DUF218 family)